jgi:hypothetical protein
MFSQGITRYHNTTFELRPDTPNICASFELCAIHVDMAVCTVSGVYSAHIRDCTGYARGWQ